MELKQLVYKLGFDLDVEIDVINNKVIIGGVKLDFEDVEDILAVIEVNRKKD